MSTPYPIVRCGVRCRCPDLDAHRMPPCWFAQTSKECLYTTPNAPGLSNQKLIFQLASENLSAKARILPLTHDRYGSKAEVGRCLAPCPLQPRKRTSELRNVMSATVME